METHRLAHPISLETDSADGKKFHPVHAGLPALSSRTWRHPMRTRQSLTVTALAAVLYLGAGLAETDSLTFEVASVKPSLGCPPACGLIRSTVGSQGYHAEGATVRSLMTVAYSVTDKQISGGPSWMNTDRFDIEAKAARQGSTDELHVMLPHLLEERFNPKLRREMREEPVWALVVAKGGVKMPVHDPNDKD